MYKLCKTEQSAARQRELENKLLEMMNICRYEEITVSDFCAHAGIPRKAFYRYFSSKDGALYALLDHTMLDYEFFRNDRVQGAARNLREELERFFQFWRSQKQLLDALEHSGLSGVLIERAIANLTESVRQKPQNAKDDPKVREHVYRFFVSGLFIMMVNWHHEGYQDSVQEMARIALRLLSEPLESIVRTLF